MSTKFENIEQIIQRYLDGNLSEEARQTIEEIYFQHDSVYEKLKFEYELKSVIKLHGNSLLGNNANPRSNE